MLLAPAVHGAPIDDKRAEAAKIQRQLQAEDNRVSVLDEQFDQATLRVDQANAAASQTNAALQRANAQFAALRDRMAKAALDSYIHGGDSSQIQSLLQGSSSDVIARRQYLQAAAADERRAIDDLRAAREDLTAARARNQAAITAAEDAARQVDAARRQVNAAIATQQANLRKVTGELAVLVKQEADKAAAAAAARVQSLVAAGKRGAQFTGPLPAVAKGALGAVQMARYQLGKPYVYGGAGPDSFDCSGLVMYSWRAAGVSLSHSAAAQYSETAHIPISALQPGDIVFFGSDLHHDGIYVGGGQMIEAPHTGANVRYASIFRSDLYAAGRPG
jgi:cell wall-associated NlpC family hydrolase